MAPAFTWSGFYIGTHTGAISLNGDIRTNGNAANTIANVTASQVLVYATGGLAGASFTDRVAFLRNTDNAFQFVGRRSTTEYGYTVGGGVEFSLPESLRQFAFIGNLLNASAVTVRAEYLYFDLGDRNVLVNAVPGAGLNSYTTRFESTGHIGRIGFNYRFGT